MFFCSSNNLYALKNTELMSEALRQRSNGNIEAAIKGFQKAVDGAPSLLQRNLALFMLGDCQMEFRDFKSAITTYTELSKKATTADERAEALYKIMEANSNLNNTEEVNKAYSEIKKKYPKSAYFKIAEAFINAGEVLDSDYNDTNEINDFKTELEKEKSEQIKEKAEPVKASEKIIASAKASKQESKEEKIKEKEDKTESGKTNKQTETTKTSQKSKQSFSDSSYKKLDDKTTSLLESIINIDPASETERELLVSKILSCQDKLKSGERDSGKDKVLFELAETTAKFGELLEACKTYDKILSLHPTSPLVEDAYYQAIRLRAILGVHQAVIEWSKAFNIAFPNSKYKQNIAALVSYSKAGGKVKMANVKSSENAKNSKSTSTKSDSDSDYRPKKTDKKASKAKVQNRPAKTDLDSSNTALKNSSLYQKASKKMNDGEYTSALEDLKVLESKFPDASQLWWDTSLVYVQLEEFRKADKTIRKMLQLEPDNSDANSLLGYIQYRLENYDEAANAYEQAGEDESEGVTFYDAKTASKRMKKNASK